MWGPYKGEHILIGHLIDSKSKATTNTTPLRPTTHQQVPQQQSYSGTLHKEIK